MIELYLSRKVVQMINNEKVEIEFEIIHYPNYYKAVATICQDFPPFKDFIAFGKSSHSQKRAIQKAIKDLNQQAYTDHYQNA